MALDRMVGFRIPSRNATRWNSQFSQLLLFSKALETNSAIQSSTGLKAFQKHGSLSVRETKLIKEVILVLQPFKDATDAFQKEHESVGEVIPGYQHMVNTMSDLTKNNSKLTHCKELARSLLTSLQTRLSYVLQDIVYVLGELYFIKYSLKYKLIL